MILPDVNVFVYAFRKDAPRHAEYKAWIERSLAGDVPVAIVPQSLTAVIRIATNPRVWKRPSRLDDVISFVERVLEAPAATMLDASPGCWPIFFRICRTVNARGNLVMDAWLAALAIDSGCTLVTTDRDFGRFPGLRWRHPLD